MIFSFQRRLSVTGLNRQIYVSVIILSFPVRMDKQKEADSSLQCGSSVVKAVSEEA